MSDGIPDNYFFVSNPIYLENALDKAFKDILATSSASSVATNSTSLNTGSFIYQARFNTNFWSGQLRALSLDSVTGAVDPDAVWDSGEVIDGQTGSRQIITYDQSTSDGIPFLWGDLPTVQQDLLDLNDLGVDDNRGEDRVNYLRGSKVNEGPSATQFRVRESNLGDIVNSSPVYVGAPEAGWASETYRTFRSDNLTRTPLIYAGSNDGMLHGFRVDTGAEVFAYVPRAIYPDLSKFTGQNYAHKYFVDGTPMVNDIELNNAVLGVRPWKTVLVGGLNWGGRAFYALDITDPTILASAETGTNPSDIAMWEFTDANDSDLGYTHVQPTYPPFQGISQQIRKMYNGKWAAILGNGYNSTNGKAALFILFVDHSGGTWADGTDYIKLVADTGPDNGLSTPMPYDIDGDGVVDMIYAGDLKGNLWQFDVTHSNPANWKVGLTGTPLFVAMDSGSVRQPITTAPRVKKHPNGGAMVLFGTGKYLENSDTSGPFNTQTFYGIWDKDGATAVAGRSELVEQTVLATVTVGSNDYRITSANTVDWATKRGWYMDLPSSSTTGERVTYNALVRNSRIVFPTLIPSPIPCKAGGSSWLMELDADTGSRLSGSPFDIDGDGDFDADDMLSFNSNSYVAGGVKPSDGGIITTPTVIKDGTDPSKEHKYASSSTGDVAHVVESSDSSAGAGRRINWREIIE